MEDPNTVQTPGLKPSTTPVLISTLLLLLAVLSTPIMLLTAAFNDNDDSTVTTVTYGLLGFFLLTIVAQAVVLNITARKLPAKQIQRASKSSMAMVGLLPLIVALYFAGVLVNAMPFTLVVVQLVGFLSFVVLPAVMIATIVFSFKAVARSKA